MSSRSTIRAGRGFTLVEIMIVVMVIGILLAIAIPNFLKARQTSQARVCQGNLRQLDTAKQQWAIDQKAGPTATPAMTDLIPTYVKNTPQCPAGGSYTVNSMQTDPACTFSTTDSKHAMLQ